MCGLVQLSLFLGGFSGDRVNLGFSGFFFTLFNPFIVYLILGNPPSDRIARAG